jgi:integrase
MASIERRKADDGAVTFRVKVRLKGHPVQSATFARLTDAKKWAQQTEAAIREGRHFKTVEAKRHTLAEMVDRYIREIMPRKPKSAAQQTPQLLWWKSAIGEYTLADVTPALIGECRERLAQQPFAETVGSRSGPAGKARYRSPSTVLRYLAALSHVYTVAVKEWGWVDDSPMRKVTKPKESRGRVRYLSEKERDALLACAERSGNADLYPAMVLALSTGARRMEIMGLRWKQVDLSRGVITLDDTKNGEIRALPLVSKAHGLMLARSKVRRIDTDLVFPANDGKKPIDLRSPFEKALKDAGIEDFRWHDLRHTCASYLAMNGASLAEIAEVLGHKTLQMVRRYAHLSHAHTARVVASMNEKMFGGSNA